MRRTERVWRRLAAMIGAWSAIGFAASSHAELITFRFEATVTEVSVIPSTLTNSTDWPDVGDAFRGTYTFDSNAVDTAADPEVGIYRTPVPDGAIFIEAGSLQLQGSASYIYTSYNDTYGAGSWFPHLEIVEPAGLVFDSNLFSLLVAREGLLNETGIPLVPPMLVGAVINEVSLILDRSGNTSPNPYVTIGASLNSLTLVPEPSTLGLHLLGTTMIIALRKGRA